MMNTVDRAIDVLDVEENRQRFSIEKIINYFAGITQFCTWPILFVIFNLFFKFDISGRDNLKKLKAPFIIIANHSSYYDSFLFRIILGAFTPFLPLRFMAVKSFDSRWMNMLSSIGVIDFIYSLFGVFTVVPGLGINKNLEKAKRIIFSKGNVVIYPEGRVNKSDYIGLFKDGAAVLYQRTQVDIIPISIRKLKDNNFRKKLIINIGQKIDIKEVFDQKRLTNKFRNEIIALHNKVR